MKEDIQPLTPGQRDIMAKIGAPELTATDIAHGIPHDKGEQRCQAVGGDAEGKVPTTAPACALTSPGSNTAAGAVEPMTADETTVAEMLEKLLESLAKARDERDQESARAKAAMRLMVKYDRERVAAERKLAICLHALDVLRRDSKSPDFVKVYCAVIEDEISSGGGGAEQAGDEQGESQSGARSATVPVSDRAPKTL